MNRIAILTALLLSPALFAQGDLNADTETAMKLAVKKVSPTVVRIETSGGQEMVVWSDRSTGAPIRKVAGPTTGVIIDADGFIITSSFNFINKPTDIIVTIAGKGRSVAKVVAIDQSRMLTLLKVEPTGLTVPEALPKKEILVGDWSMALGRSLSPNVDQTPSVSVGIVSATGRIWGKAVQTDAKVSPVNYGGPLVGIDGRVMGILVPASPTSEGENAGVEWYDSGIGFAIPLEDIFRILPKLKAGANPDKPFNLRGGMFGFSAPSPNEYLEKPIIKLVVPDSAADKAGVKSGDEVISVDGKRIFTMAQFLHSFKPLYEGDTFAMVVKRGGKEVSIEKVILQGSQTTVEPGFLGVLPMRDDPELGVEIRYVYPDSPAAKAKLVAGDRIMKLAPVTVKELQSFAGRDAFLQLMSNLPANNDVKLEVKHADNKTETLTVRLGSFPEATPDKLPIESSKGKALEKPKQPAPPVKIDPKNPPKKAPPPEEPKKAEPKRDPKEKVETGMLKRKNATLGRDYWVFVPRNYDPNVAHGLIVWLHPANRPGRDADDMRDLWEFFCEDYHFIMVGPISEAKTGWAASESDGVIADVNAVLGDFTIDKQRIVAHGAGVGGQMAYYLGFQARDLIRGVATVGAALATQPKDAIPGQRLNFFIAVGTKDPLLKEIEEGKPKLTEKKYPVVLRKIEDLGKQYIAEDRKAFRELMLWLDCLDRN